MKNHVLVKMLLLSTLGCLFCARMLLQSAYMFMQRIHCQCPVYYYVHSYISHCKKLFRSQTLSAAMRDIGGGVLTLRSPNSSCSYHLLVLAHTKHTYHPYLVSFPFFYTIPICLLFKIRRIFYLLVSSNFYIHQCKSLSGGQAPE